MGKILFWTLRELNNKPRKFSIKSEIQEKVKRVIKKLIHFLKSCSLSSWNVEFWEKIYKIGIEQKYVHLFQEKSGYFVAAVNYIHFLEDVSYD